MNKLFTLILFVLIGHISLNAQCSPAGALTCEEAGLLCGLDELDGYSCTTLSTSNPTGPNPLCGGAGVPNNTQWWSFYGDYKNITVTFNTNYNNCSLGKGIEAGVMQGCDGQPIVCNSDCNAEVFSFTFWAKRCQKYFLWIDGCDGDICDFDIQIENGEGPKAFSYKPRVNGPVQCQGTEIQVCVESDNSPCDRPSKWILRGQDVPNSNGKSCIKTNIPIDSPPFEVCAEFTVGNGIIICDQKVNCFVVIPDPIGKEDDGEIFVCWEEHEGNGFIWRDSLIYSSCVDPPCKIIQSSKFDCLIEYRSQIHILAQQEFRAEYQFICDQSELPYRTEDGSLWYENVCDEEITWSNVNYHDCDTTYILYLEVFNPEVNITTSCPDCNGFLTIYTEIEYYPNCSVGQISWVKFWLNESGDTVGIGDTIMPNKEGKYSLILQVAQINEFTGEINSCNLVDTSWYINVQFDSLSITGDRLICDVDTSEFTLPNSYANGCEILWTIEDVNGQIITADPEKKARIEVKWPDNNTSGGRICAEIVDACDSTKKVCRTLEGCIITKTKNSDKKQWMVYPNPARDELFITGNNLDEMKIQMQDIRGNEIIAQPKRAIGGGFSIDVEDLASGIYFIRLGKRDDVRLKKFVKL